MLIFKREVSPPLSAQAQQARKIYTSSALQYNVAVLFRIDYNTSYQDRSKYLIKTPLNK